ncbi:MAG TPA: hypothetical protein VE961_22650 [Pyrinomonadaceae bacterium]|nr:hypothetical protein [Pyrinomonadaceae bacterium]
MGFIADTAKKIAFWNYSRTSWQWDVLCVLILCFIFLTPKSWFVSHPPIQTAIILSADLVEKQGDKAESEIVQRAKQQLNRANGQVVYPVRPRRDDSGKVIAYEVDIR